MTLSPILIENAVRAALLEDLGHGFDITTQSVLSSADNAKAMIRTREEGVLAGLIPALSAFSYTDPDFGFLAGKFEPVVVDNPDCYFVEAGFPPLNDNRRFFSAH